MEPLFDLSVWLRWWDISLLTMLTQTVLNTEIEEKSNIILQFGEHEGVETERTGINKVHGALAQKKGNEREEREGQESRTAFGKQFVSELG